jgi:hypothetical protein
MLFIGLLVATFIGVGIAAFHSGPKMPEPPISIKYQQPSCEQLKNCTDLQKLIKEQVSYDKSMKVFESKSKLYNRDVSVISIVFALITLVISLTLFKKILLIADGLLLGSVFTLIYSIIRGFNSGDNMYRFIIVSIGLIVSLFLGYIKFIKSSK